VVTRPHWLCAELVGRDLPALRKLLWQRLGDQLAYDLRRRSVEGLHERLQLLPCVRIEAELKPPIVIARLMGPAAALPRTPAVRKVFQDHLAHGMPQPGGHCDGMALGGLLHLVEQVRFHQHVHKMRAIWHRWVDGPCGRMSERPLHDVPQDRCALPVERRCQRL
jgi:hypothetical protein